MRLEFPFSSHGYRHVLLARSGRWCVVERAWIGDGKPHLPHYEVVQLQAVPTKTWPNGRVTLAHEGYPAPTHWGRRGWSEPTLRHAIIRWERLRAEHPELPGPEDIGLVDDVEGWEAWKAGRLRCPPPACDLEPLLEQVGGSK